VAVAIKLIDNHDSLQYRSVDYGWKYFTVQASVLSLVYTPWQGRVARMAFSAKKFLLRHKRIKTDENEKKEKVRNEREKVVERRVRENEKGDS
jgi:hypothetical protein